MKYVDSINVKTIRKEMQKEEKDIQSRSKMRRPSTLVRERETESFAIACGLLLKAYNCPGGMLIIYLMLKVFLFSPNK